jgi:hypothetical protein
MPWPYTKDEIASVLVGKFGFERDQSHHQFYVLTLDGRSAAYTYVSHGHRDRVTPKIAFRMAQEMRLANLQQFRDAIDCPLTAEQYYQQLRAEQDEGHQPGAEASPTTQLAEPRQPIHWVWTVSGRSFGFIQDACLYTHDGRNVGRLVGGSEEIYALDGRYLGEVRNYNTLVVVDERTQWTENPCDPDPPLRPQHPWSDRDPHPMAAGLSDFPHPNSL